MTEDLGLTTNELDIELAQGKQLAQELVEHLQRVGAAEASFPLETHTVTVGPTSLRRTVGERRPLDLAPVLLFVIPDEPKVVYAHDGVWYRCESGWTYGVVQPNDIWAEVPK